MLKRRVVRDPKKEAITFGAILLAAVAVFFIVLNRYTARSLHAEAEGVFGNIHCSLSMPNTTFGPGKPVPVKLTVKNISQEVTKLTFDSTLEFDVIVKRDVNLWLATVPFKVWQYSASHPGGAERHTRELKPGETISYSVEWPQVNAQNEPVEEGRYIIEGALNVTGARHLLELSGGRR
ncbi:MAG: hypothetical protein EB084_06650 [Proteobacteria bacterium]|nr:hypothetical protein [Pseudomonadota bacterium]